MDIYKKNDSTSDFAKNVDVSEATGEGQEPVTKRKLLSHWAGSEYKTFVIYESSYMLSQLFNNVMHSPHAVLL